MASDACDVAHMVRRKRSRLQAERTACGYGRQHEEVAIGEGREARPGCTGEDRWKK